MAIEFSTPSFKPREYEGEYISYTLYGLDSDGDELDDIITSPKKSTVIHTIKELRPDYRRIYNGMHVVAILYDENDNMLDSVVVWSTDQYESSSADDPAWQVRVEFDLNGKREFTHIITHAGNEAEAKKNAAAYVGREYSGSKNIAVMDAKALPKHKSEKLSYEKGHKNSKGEDAPWVIRSHKDDSVLASFPTKKEAENHMKTMKRYSKTEGKFTEIKAAIKAAWSAAEAKWFRLDFREATERLDVYPIASDNEGVGVNWGVLPERNTIVQYATDLRTGDNQVEREMPYKDLDELEKIFVDEFKSMDETLEVGADNGADIHPLTESAPKEVNTVLKKNAPKLIDILNSKFKAAGFDVGLKLTDPENASFSDGWYLNTKGTGNWDSRSRMFNLRLSGTEYNGVVYKDGNIYLKKGARPASNRGTVVHPFGAKAEATFHDDVDIADGIDPIWLVEVHWVDPSEDDRLTVVRCDGEDMYDAKKRAVRYLEKERRAYNARVVSAELESPAKTEATLNALWCVEFCDIYSNVKKEYYDTEADAKARYDELAERGDIEWVEGPVMEAAAKEEAASYADYAESVKAILMGREFEYGPETANEFVVDDYKEIVRKNFDAGKNAFAAAADIDDAYMGKE